MIITVLMEVLFVISLEGIFPHFNMFQNNKRLSENEIKLARIEMGVRFDWLFLNPIFMLCAAH